MSRMRKEREAAWKHVGAVGARSMSSARQGRGWSGMVGGMGDGHAGPGGMVARLLAQLLPCSPTAEPCLACAHKQLFKQLRR